MFADLRHLTVALDDEGEAFFELRSVAVRRLFELLPNG